MKLKLAVEQAVCVLILLQKENDRAPIKNSEISKRLGVSDSYLKKIMRKLVLEGLIDSDASRFGGFKLKKKLENITMLDVYYAIEGRESFITLTHIANRIFDKKELIDRKESDVLRAFSEAEELFLKKLESYKLSYLVP